MELGVVKIADDADFQLLKEMVDNPRDWVLNYDKSGIKVLAKQTDRSSHKMIKVVCEFPMVNPQDLYDVIHDPDYRKIWDQSMIESIDIGHLNPNNDICYYAVACPLPMTNRDFVLQRSWLDVGKEQYIINHSVSHKDFPPRRCYVRAFSLFTGYLIRRLEKGGCSLGYVTQSDLQGDLPTWLVNKATTILAPKYLRQLEKASLGYSHWKSQNNPNLKPWSYPEQIMTPKLPIDYAASNPPQPVRLKEQPLLKEVSDVPILPSPLPPICTAPSKTKSFTSQLSLHDLPSPAAKNRFLSCFNFTKHCISKNNDPSLP